MMRAFLRCAYLNTTILFFALCLSGCIGGGTPSSSTDTPINDTPPQQQEETGDQDTPNEAVPENTLTSISGKA